MASKETSSASTGAIGSGFCIAAIMSWTKVHSILWCLLHGALGWGYVIWHVVKKDY